MKKFLLAFFLIIAGTSMIISQTVVDFEDLMLEQESFWNGSDETGSFTSKYLKFYNSYDKTYNSWMGFAYSNTTDNTTPGYENQYSSIAGSGFANSSNYAVAFIGEDWVNNKPVPASIKIDKDNAPGSYNGMYISLNTYSALYMEQDGGYEEKNHWLTMQIKAINTDTFEEIVQNFVIADYRFPTEDGFKLDEWTYIDLSWADGKDSLLFTMNSDDIQYGSIYTPTYFCMDNFGADAPQNTSGLVTEAKTIYNIEEGESVEIFVSAKGGIQPYSFIWDNEESLDDNKSQTPLASPSATTTYNVTITDAAGNQNTKNITVNVGKNDIKEYNFDDLKIYINEESVIISNTQIINKLTVFDVNGRKLLNSQSNSDKVEIPISCLAKGMYILNITCGQNQISKKIIR